MKSKTNFLQMQSCADCPIKSGSSNLSKKCCTQYCGNHFSNYCPDNFLLENYKIKEKLVSTLGIKFPMLKSNELWIRGSKAIPGGTQTLGKGPIGFIDGVAPKYLDRGRGSRVWDVDGNEYIDCWLACLPITFGYCIKEIDDSIRSQLDKGISFSLMHSLEVEAAEMLIQDIPIAEQVRFAKNGSDVCEAAIRLARYTTGRDMVITLGYHGFHDWYIASTDRNFGIPQAIQELTLRTSYNNLEHVKCLFELNKDRIACVILEPAIFELPQNDYLKELKEYVHSQGALLIFDEMLTGYRFSRGGAMSFFDVTPDLATFGKGIANGMPIGMLVGPEKIMRGFDKVFFSSTYGGETTALAATIAGLQYHRKYDVVGHMWRIGKIVLDGFNREIKRAGIENYVGAIGYPVRQTLTFKDSRGDPDYNLAGLFQQEMLTQGILCNSGLGFSHSHSENDAMYIVRAFAKTADILADAINSGDILKLLRGTPAQPVFKGLRNQRVTSN